MTLLPLVTAMTLLSAVPVTGSDSAAKPATPAPAFTDTESRESLLLALQRQIQAFDGQTDRRLWIGRRQTSLSHLRRTLLAFADVVRSQYGTPAFTETIHRRFELVPEGDAYVTGYYQPLLEARTHREGEFQLPLYRYVESATRYSRREIEAGALAGRCLEIAWVRDPFARYSLMVQGSGLLHFPDGRTVNVNFAGSNHHPYRSLGRIFMAEGLLSEQTLSWQAIKAYLQAHPGKREAYFNRNPSYCFFKLTDGGPFGLSRLPLTAGRSIATDKRLYPAGALAYLTVPEHGIARFAVDQDTGGAIRGKARVDLFLGAGEVAEDLAGRLKHHGRLTYLLLRESAR